MNAGTGCLNCSEVLNPPAEFIVTFANHSLCSCVNIGGSGVLVTLNTALNGAHTLTKGTGCSWQKTVTGGAQIDTWNTDPTCGGAPDSSNTVDYVITLTKRATDWDLNVSTSGFPQFDLFSDTQTADTYGGGGQVCMSFSGMFENDHTTTGDCGSAGGLFSLTIMGFDGEATIVCV